MKLTKKEITYLSIGTTLTLVGLAVAGILIFADQSRHLFLATSLGDGFIAAATFFFVVFGLNRYIAGKNLSQDEKKKADKLANLLAAGTSIIVLFLIPFGKIMIERDNGLVLWAAILAGVFAITGTILCLIAGINWKQEIINKE